MLDYRPSDSLPTAAELPDSDDTPVDNEFQNLIPNLLLAVLNIIWRDRTDWYFGVDMGIYHTTDDNLRSPIIPDGFLSLGIERFKGTKGRLSYVVWEENNQVPQLVIEVVSHSYGEEYGEKLKKYARLGVLYYVIYNPDYWRRDKHDAFEVYRLVAGNYVRQAGNRVWLPELGLGIGHEFGQHLGWQREWLYWYNEQGDRYPTPEERAKQAEARAEQAESRVEQAESRAEQAESRAERLAKRLQALGIQLDELEP
jgi:Uma2 family endonuclease